MTRVILPEFVARRMRYEQMMSTADRGYISHWNRRLAEIKPGLALARAGENGRGPGIVPGCWHIRWRDPEDKGAPDSYFAITTNGIGVPGGYREMASDVLEWCRRSDMWDRRVKYDKERRSRLNAEAEERAKATAKEQRVYEIASNINALERPSALFSEDVRWAAKPAGNRGRKAA